MEKIKFEGPLRLNKKTVININDQESIVGKGPTSIATSPQICVVPVTGVDACGITQSTVCCPTAQTDVVPCCTDSTNSACC